MIWVFWRKGFWSLQSHITHAQFIHTPLQLWFITFVYGKNKREEWRQLWAGLPQLYNAPTNLPWIAIGYLNKTSSSEEKMGCGIYNHGSQSEFIPITNLGQLQ